MAGEMNSDETRHFRFQAARDEVEPWSGGYRIKGYREFWNGHTTMVEVWGVCRADGQHVRAFMPLRVFNLRVDRLNEEEHRADWWAVFMQAADDALTHARSEWPRREA